jgi:hypothetical protein
MSIDNEAKSSFSLVDTVGGGGWAVGGVGGTEARVTTAVNNPHEFQASRSRRHGPLGAADTVGMLALETL